MLMSKEIEPKTALFLKIGRIVISLLIFNKH